MLENETNKVGFTVYQSGGPLDQFSICILNVMFRSRIDLWQSSTHTLGNRAYYPPKMPHFCQLRRPCCGLAPSEGPTARKMDLWAQYHPDRLG